MIKCRIKSSTVEWSDGKYLSTGSSRVGD